MNDKPKELEEHSAQIFEFGCMERPVYLKEDVDAVIAELKAENERLKKCEIWMKQHFYCEEVIACESAKNRKLKRALWLARAISAINAVGEIHNLIVCMRERNPKMSLSNTEAQEQVWKNVARKCRAKAKEYK